MADPEQRPGHVVVRIGGANLVLDVVRVDSTLALGAGVVRPMGHLTIVGIGDGSIPLSLFSVPYGATVATTYWGQPARADGRDNAGPGRPHQGARHHVTLEKAADAYDALRTGQLDGCAVIVA